MTTRAATYTATQQDLIDDFRDRSGKCDTVADLVDLGVELFSFTCFDGAVKTCWPIFRARMDAIAPEDHQSQVTVFDFPAIFWAAYSRGGAECGHDVASRIVNIGSELSNEPTNLLISHDSRTSQRRDRYPSYKSSRDEKPADFESAREDALSHLKNIGMTVVMAEGWESDDVMASVAFRAKLRKQKCTIVTDDRDLMQCCGHGTVCYSPRNHEYASETSLLAKHNITVKQVVDWLCMSGKDDVPSIAGVGAKTAAEWLQKYSDFWGVFDARSELTEKKRKSLEDFAFSGNYWLARDLHTLNKKLPVLW
jgi:hypothetical protein